MALIYWRDVPDTAADLLVCRECERITEDPAAASNFSNVCLAGVVYAICTRCGKKEKLPEQRGEQRE